MVDRTEVDSGPIDSQSAAPAIPSSAPPSTPTAAPPPTPTAEAAPPTPTSTPEPATVIQAEASDKEGMLALLREKIDAKDEAPAREPEAKTEATTDMPVADAKAEADDEGDDGDEVEALTPEERAEAGNKVARKVSRLLRNVKRLKPDADAYRNITKFMAENRLTGQEAAQGFEVMALLKADDPRALDVLRPYIDRLSAARGDVLPGDLQSKVEQGYIDQESAKEIAALRHQRERDARMREVEQSEQQSYEVQHKRTTIASALNEWEARQQTNPDYSAVKTAVFDYAKASFAAQPPASAADAVKRIEGFYNQLRQRPGAGNGVVRPVQPIRPGPSSAHSPASLPAREPQTLEESIRMALQRRGAA